MPKNQERLLKYSVKARRWSRDFAWPTLLLFLLGPGSTYTSSSEFGLYLTVAAPLALGALLLRLWSRGYVRESVKFVVNGPYRYVRNPVELGSLLGYTAAGLALKLSPPYLLMCLLLAFVHFSLTALHYEREMVERLGKTYVGYAHKVRRWIPSRLPLINSDCQDYLLSRALILEAPTLLWIIGWILVFALRQRWHAAA